MWDTALKSGLNLDDIDDIHAGHNWKIVYLELKNKIEEYFEEQEKEQDEKKVAEYTKSISERTRSSKLSSSS